MQIIRDIWLCSDCCSAAANGDFTGLDYHYDEPEATQRMNEIEAGLDALPGLVPDCSDEPERRCCECDHTGPEGDFEASFENPDTDEEEEFRRCPKCNSYDTEARGSGEAEFSWSDCDCCGSSLGGSRFRFAQLIQEETTP